MKQRWITLSLLVLASLILATGCVRKSPKNAPGIDPNNLGSLDEQLIIGYDADGNPIYAEGADSLVRTDAAMLGAGQFEAVYFDYDSPQLNPAEQNKIAMVVTYLQQNPTQGIVIEGHCDERGSNEYNLALGERRALAVRAAMISSGIDGARIQTSSRGEETPVAFGHDDAAWRLNRRAEFLLTQM